MTVTPLSRPRDERLPPRPRLRAEAPATTRERRVPTRADLQRRRLMVTATKYLLPVGALALLTTIAMWPEFDRARDEARLSFKQMAHAVSGATLSDARYRSVDERGRPYTITAVSADQISPERVDLSMPKGDLTLENGTWLMLQSRQGIYMQRAKQLDLSQDVTLYRDDGMTVRTETASIDLHDGAAAGADPVHVEGPIGTLDAAGFALMDKGDQIQFGPGRAVMNASSHDGPAVPPPPADTIPSAPPAPPVLAMPVPPSPPAAGAHHGVRR